MRLAVRITVDQRTAAGQDVTAALPASAMLAPGACTTCLGSTCCSCSCSAAAPAPSA
jgi:hypothetical protein